MADKSQALIRKRWDDKKLGYMESGLFAKFWSPLALFPDGEDLLGKLFRTGQRELVYAVEDDSVWGIGYRPGNAEKNRGRWGQNLLGKARIMGARATALLHSQLGICRGKLIASKEERLYRTALMLEKLKGDKDDNLEVVKHKCPKGEELQAITRMAEVARNGPGACLAKDIVRRMRESRGHEMDCGRNNI